MGSRLVRTVVGSLAVAALMVGCTSDVDPGSAPKTTRKVGPSYVALGDSFTSGPGLAPMDTGAGTCLRSTVNWARQLSTELNARNFRDVSCGGAKTADVLAPHSGVPAQLDALAADTDLVTISIGGNDDNLFGSLVLSCAQGSTQCATYTQKTAPAVLPRIVSHIMTVVEAIRAKAPDATVLLVGYLRIAPDSGTCPGLGIAADVTPVVSKAEAQLDETMANAAEKSGIGYVSMRAASEGHDACAGAKAWTNGFAVPDSDGTAFHPRSAGMSAVTEAVAEAFAKG